MIRHELQPAKPLGSLSVLGALALALVAAAIARGDDYLYSENSYDRLPPAPIESLAVYPIDYPFAVEGLVSFARTQANEPTNVEKLYRRTARNQKGGVSPIPPYMQPRDLLSYCLYLDIKQMQSNVKDHLWIARVDFGPDPTKIEFYDLKLSGRLDVVLKEKGEVQQLDLMLVLSCPRNLTYVRRFRTRFEAPAYQPMDEAAMLPALRTVNAEICAWLRGEIGALNAGDVQTSRLDKATGFITGQWDQDLPLFTRELREAIENDAPPTVISTWAQAYYDRWYESGVLYDDVVLFMPTLECKTADEFCYSVLSTWAAKYKQRDRAISRAKAAQTALAILAVAAIAGGVAVDVQQLNQTGNYSGTYTGAGMMVATGAIALSAKVESELAAELARIEVDPRFDVGDIVARIENVEGGRYRGFKERLRDRPDRAVEIAAEFYGKDRQSFDEVAATALRQQRTAVGASAVD
jgi:hypothetical protein